MSRRLLLAVAAVAALLLIAVFLGRIAELPSEALGRAVAGVLGRELDADVEVGGTRLTFAEGLTLRGVRIRPARPGAGTEITAERIVLAARPAALLGGRLAVERAVVVRPRIVVTEPGAPSALPERPQPEIPPTPPATPALPARPEPEPGPVPGAERLEVALRELRLADATVVLQRPGAKATTIEGLDLVLSDVETTAGAPSAVAALTAAGTVSVKRAELEAGTLTQATGRVRLAGGVLSFSDVTFTSRVGRFRAAGDVTLGRSPVPHALTFTIDPLDLAALTGSPETDRFGGATLEAETRGAGADPSRATGAGVLKVAAGRLPYFPVLRELEAALRRVTLWETPYEAVEARFRIAGGSLSFDPFTLRAEGLAATIAGRVGLDGALDLVVLLEADRDKVSLQDVPDDVRTALTVEGGRLAVPARVKGTASAPRVEADVEALIQRSRSRGDAVDEQRLRTTLSDVFG